MTLNLRVYFKNSSKFVLFTFMLMLFSAGVDFVNANSARAYIGTPDASCPTKRGNGFSGDVPVAGSNVPGYAYNALNVADCASQCPTLASWLVGSGTMSSSVTATGGTSVGLSYGVAETVGLTNCAVTEAQWNIVEAPAGTNAIGRFAYINLRSGYNVVGRTDIGTTSFTYSPAGGFVDGRTYSVRIGVKGAQRFTSGAILCTTGGGSTGSLSASSCGTAYYDFRIIVRVPNNPPSGSITASCYAQSNVTYVSVSYRLTDADNNRLSGSISGSGSGNPVPYTTFSGRYPGNYTLTGSPFVFNGTYRNTYSISGSVSDGIATRSLSPGSFNCPGPPIISCTMTGNTIEVGTNLTPSMTISNSNPSSSSLTATVTFSASSDVSGSFVNLTGASPSSPTTVSYSNSRAITFSPLTPSTPGRINLRGNFSWTTSGNAYFGSGNCTNATADVVRKPFFVNKGGDMLVGGAYPSSAGTCPGSTPTGNLSSWANATSVTSRSGANAELMARVYGIAFEFYSASTVASTNTPAGKFRNWLTVANNDSTRPWGGGSGEVGCLKDFYKETKKTTLPISSISSASVESLDATASTNEQIEINGNLIITGASTFAGKVAVYVNGNVHIQNNITLNENYSSNPANIPFFSLIVRGNIFIGPGVDRLDGIYVAQPNPTTNGIIYTCANSLTLYLKYENDQIYNSCNRQLIFNGIVQAREMKLLRVWGTLRENIPAEVFNYMPELYIANSAFVNNSSGLPPYDSAASLPPAL